MSNDEASRQKVLLVGDLRCGKIGLIFSYFSGELPPDEPQVYKEYLTEVDVNGEKVPLEIWIAPCEDHYSQIRTMSYDDVKVILLCFSVDAPKSLTNAKKKWFPEIKQYSPDVPIILVGNKIDLRSDVNVSNAISYEQGKEVADKLKCYQYIENSAKNVENVKEVFKAAAAAILKK